VNSESSRILHSLQRNIIRGVITAGPLFITWLVFTFILGVLANAGLPLVKLLGLPFPADSWVNHPWLQYGLAVLVMVGLFYLIGRATSQVRRPAGFCPVRGLARTPSPGEQDLRFRAPTD
jgi:uncharacterized membrane protein